MQFDTFTALTGSCAVLAILGAIFLLYWHRTHSLWLGWWALAFCFFGAGNYVTTIRMGAPATPLSGIGNALLILGIALLWSSMRLFEGRRPRVWSIVVATVLWSAVFPFFQQALMARVMLFSVLAAAGLGLAASELWRGRGEGLASKRPAATLFALSSLLFALRVPLGPFFPYPLGGLPADAGYVAGFNVALIALALVLTVFIISMTHERAEKALRELAVTDPLTGMLNRRGLDAAFPEGILPAGSALIVFDLDRFKLVNDSFGHAAGDTLIAAFALICREELRQVDHAVRIGGEEFVLVLPRTDEAAALALAERVRARYAFTVVPIEEGALVGTASGGVFCAGRDRPVGLAQAIEAADQAMYRAKQQGRNRIASAPTIPDASRSFDERCVEPSEQAASF